MQEPTHPYLRIQAMKYSNYMAKFALINGNILAKFTVSIVGKKETESFRCGRFTMVDEEAAQFVSLGDASQIRLFPEEFLTYRLKITRDHPHEKIWFKLCREYKSSRSGRKMTVTYLVPIVIEDDGIHIRKQKKQFAVKVW